jgi:tetratricopeptide (TPR) repeat protein
MAPEQARGTGEDVDERSDVFGLGSILCTMLTGQPPYVGPGRDEVMRKAAAGDLADAFTRLDASSADGELVQLARACLAVTKEDRPRDAGVVAERVKAYLAGVQERLHAAELERAAAEARATAERRARRIVLGLAVAVLLVLLGGIAGTTWGLLRAEKKQLEAEKQKERAQKAEKETLEDYRESTGDAMEQLIGSKPVLGPQEKSYLEKTLKRWQAFAARTGDDERSRAIRADGHFHVAMLRAKLGQTDEALAGYGEGLAIQQKLADDFPSVGDYRRDLARGRNNLGSLLADKKQWEKAAEQYREALSIQQKLIDDFPDVLEYRKDLAATYNNLGLLLFDQNQWDKAAEQYHKALGIQKTLADAFPNVPSCRKELAGTHNNLGNLLAEQHEGEKATEQYAKALGLYQKLTKESPDVLVYRNELAGVHYNLGIVLKKQRQVEKSVEHFHKALAVQQKLADEFPSVPDYRYNLAGSHTNLGDVLALVGERTKSAEHYLKGSAIQERLAEDFPDRPAYQSDLGMSCCNYGRLLLGSGKLADSLPWFDKAIRALNKVHQQNPRAMNPRLLLCNSHMGRASAHDRMGKHAEAIKDWTRAVELSPSEEQWRFRVHRADSRVRAGQVAEAISEVADLRMSATVGVDQWYDFACIYSVASGKDAEKKQEYAESAMRCLRHAVQAGFKDAAHMAKDKDLDVLRSRDDFKKLLESLAKPKEKGPAGK